MPDHRTAPDAHAPTTRGPIPIPGTAQPWWQLTTAVYDYATDPVHCPICGGVGIPWAGYFHCDGLCHALAVVADGRTFLPVPRVAQEAPPCPTPIAGA